MKARPVSPYRLKIRQLELEIEDLRRLDAEWRADRNAQIVAKSDKTDAQIARRFNLCAERVRQIQSAACGGA